MLREEFDDWAVLFNPDTGHGFGLSPTGVYLWKLLDGEHTIEALLKMIHGQAEGVPEEAGDHIGTFIDVLVKEGLAGFDRSRFSLRDDAASTERRSSHSPASECEMKPGTYEPPKLVYFSRADEAHGSCSNGSGDYTCSSVGVTAGGSCGTGTGGYCTGCCSGNCDTYYGCGTGDIFGEGCSTGPTARTCCTGPSARNCFNTCTAECGGTCTECPSG